MCEVKKIKMIKYVLYRCTECDNFFLVDLQGKEHFEDKTYVCSKDSYQMYRQYIKDKDIVYWSKDDQENN